MVYDTRLNRQTIISSHAFSTKTYMYEYYKLLKKKISLERYFKAYTEGFILERVKSNRFLNLLFFSMVGGKEEHNLFKERPEN